MFLRILILLTLINSAQAGNPSLCDFLDIAGCEGVTKQARRLSSVSMPSPSSASNLNPSAVSFDRGVGLEVIHQSGNPLNFSFASGTGRMGGALISSNMENAFFGNKLPEVDGALLKRSRGKQQYKSHKLNLAVGGRVYKSKNINFDMGIIVKRHEAVKRLNPGIGTSLRLGMVSFGASFYQDDMFLNYAGIIDPATAPWNIPYDITRSELTYTERFNVESYSVGTRIGSLAIDAGVIKSKYKFFTDEDNTSRIYLYSSAYHYKNWLFNFAVRNELSPGMKYIDNELVQERGRNEIYTGVQRSFNKHLIMGLNYNFFLLREISASATLFF